MVSLSPSLPVSHTQFPQSLSVAMEGIAVTTAAMTAVTIAATIAATMGSLDSGIIIMMTVDAIAALVVMGSRSLLCSHRSLRSLVMGLVAKILEGLL